jgi:glycosyltransferase involved in cell wall biosynthesis
MAAHRRQTVWEVMKRIPIHFFTGSLNLGGTERNILHLATRLDPERFDAQVWSDYEGEPIQTELRSRGIVCRSLKTGHSLGKPFLKRMLHHNLPYQLRLCKTLSGCRDGVVHAFGFPMAYYVTLLGRLAGCRRIIFSVQDWDVWKRSGIYSMLDRTCSRLAARVIADGEGARRIAATRQGMDRRRLVTIYDGVNTAEIEPTRAAADVRRELGLAPDRLTIGVIARLDLAKKAQDVFLDALTKLSGKVPEVQFLIVGDGSDRQEVERRVQMLPEDVRPVMAGFRSDLGSVLAALDVLVISSRWESVPKILLEAMWLGKPVVATRVGDIPEILDESCGMLVPSDTPEEMARVLLRLIQDRPYRDRLGTAGHERIVSRCLTLDDSIRCYEDLYERLARGIR